MFFLLFFIEIRGPALWLLLIGAVGAHTAAADLNFWLRPIPDFGSRPEKGRLHWNLGGFLACTNAPFPNNAPPLPLATLCPLQSPSLNVKGRLALSPHNRADDTGHQRYLISNGSYIYIYMAVSILLCVPKLEEQLTTEQFQGCDVRLPKGTCKAKILRNVQKTIKQVYFTRDRTFPENKN